MQLGFGLVTCQRNPDDPERRDDATIYEQALELGRLADESGLASYWVSEHHFVDDGYLPAMTAMLSALAAVTTRITLGTGVLLAPLWHPVRLAEDLATVDLISRGRLIVGLGLGWREEEFLGFDAPLNRKVGALRSTVDTLRGAWAGELVTDAQVSVYPRPYTPGGPPIWIGGFADAAVERAARIGDGFFASVTKPDDLRPKIDLATNVAGNRPFAIGGHVPVFVWDGPEDPWEFAREAYWYVRWKYADMGAGRSRRGEPPSAPPLDPPTEASLRDGPLVGRPEQVLEQLRSFRDLVRGDGHLVARAYLPGLPWDVQRKQVTLLGELAQALAD
jgi:alkanesulfonate monooxygenase SsuD/methylene tetrahydromethanopterin reductase-like flavin-dependent oxidoreductase (luciferase family)